MNDGTPPKRRKSGPRRGTPGPLRDSLRVLDRDALRQAREKADYTQRILADHVGCHHATIGHLERGFMTAISPDLARAIERSLNVRAGGLFAPAHPPTDGTTGSPPVEAATHSAM